MAKRAISTDEVKVLDTNSAYLGVPTLKLMENAGIAVARNLRREFKGASKIAVVCGRGNNGGDGFVAARHLASEGLDVAVFIAEPEQEISTEIAKLNFEKVRNLSRPASEFRPNEWDVIVDALLGVGVRGKIREPYRSLIKRMNQARKPIVSVDVPSGWPEEPSVRARMTVTFHAPKIGMEKAKCGKLVVADIGIPPEAETHVGPGEFVYYPKPEQDSHKGDNGRILVVGGGPFTGAPALAGMGAMYAGADLAHIAVPKHVAIPVACYSPNLIVHPLSDEVLVPQDIDKIKNLWKKSDAMVIGPGMGDDNQSRNAASELIRQCPLPMVIDADALDAVKANPRIIRGKSVVLTPHKGEFERLTGMRLSEDLERRGEQVCQAARKMDSIIIVKGRIDLVSDGKTVTKNKTGNEAMTVGGTGDVLSGICGCLLSKGMEPFHAARLAVFLNGAAGDLAFQEKGYGLLATDVAEKIPYILRRYL
ncbi:MAG: NAD(P)H-hydrate dehydratase [Thermoplasmata archaeon]